MLAAQGGMGQLGALLTLVEYLKDPAAREKELKELIEARTAAEKAVKTLTRIHGGVKKLKEADDMLAAADVAASVTKQKAHESAIKMLNEAERKCGNLVAEHARLTQLANDIAAERATLDKDTQDVLGYIEKRENAVTRREKANVRAKVEVDDEQKRLRRVNQRISAELRG